MAWRVQEKRGPWQDQEGALHIAPVNNDTAPMEGARSESTEKELGHVWFQTFFRSPYHIKMNLTIL